jgi:hypothetical protein
MSLREEAEREIKRAEARRAPCHRIEILSRSGWRMRHAAEVRNMKAARSIEAAKMALI